MLNVKRRAEAEYKKKKASLIHVTKVLNKHTPGPAGATENTRVSRVLSCDVSASIYTPPQSLSHLNSHSRIS